MGKDGALEQVDKAAKRSQSNNSYVAWREVTPKHNDLVGTMVRCKMHLIVTMRAKQEYVIEKDEKTGKCSVRKVGLAPIQREGLEFEFDVVGDMDLENNYIITKTRCSKLNGQIINKPGEDLANTLIEWLDGEVPPPEPEQEPQTQPTTTVPKEKAKTKKQLESEAKKCKTLEELKNWFIKLSHEEKTIALEAKDKRKAELETANSEQQEGSEIKGPVPMLDRLLNDITPYTEKEQLEKIDNLLDQMENANKNIYYNFFKGLLVKLNINYEIITTPF
jgi:hypothetical protein